MYKCIHCGRETESYRSNRMHQSMCMDNPHRKSQWNSGLRGKNDERCKLTEETRSKITGVASTPEKELLRRERIKEKQKNNGGLREGSGRGKSGWYKGFYCRSSWELAFVIYHLENGSDISSCKEIRYYTWEDKQLKYFPDFVLNGSIVEIKGVITEQWKQKHRENPDVSLLTQKDLKTEFEYVIQKYGKNFISLYE